MTRLATLDDVETLVEGNLRIAEETESLTLDPDVVRRGVTTVLEGGAAGRYYVVELDGKVAAQIMLTYEWSDWRNGNVWWIQSVYTWPAARGQGLFRRLFDEVEKAARAEGAVGLRLYVDQTNARAQAIYAKVGMDGEHYRVFEKMF